jgi:hypothetical protein
VGDTESGSVPDPGSTHQPRWIGSVGHQVLDVSPSESRAANITIHNTHSLLEPWCREKGPMGGCAAPRLHMDGQSIVDPLSRDYGNIIVHIIITHFA